MSRRAAGANGPLLVLVPSPLVAPSTWSALQEALAARGWESVPSVDLPETAGQHAYWQNTVGGVRSLRRVPDGRHVVLVGYSGAGALLPSVGAAIRQPIAAYVFVDAGLPAPGRSRLESMAAEGPDGAAFSIELGNDLEGGRRYPDWTDTQLAPLVPDPQRLRQLVAAIQPRGREYWTEPLPEMGPWPDAPCAYLQFTDAYQFAAERAKALGWPVRRLHGGHFHHLVDEQSVADAILALLADIDGSWATLAEETTMGYVKEPGVDAYIEALPDWQQAVCRRVRELVHEADPEVVETIKRTVQPYFVLQGNICALLATKDHVNVFLYDPTVADPEGIITAGHGNETGRQIAIYRDQAINEKALVAMFREIVAHNRAGGWRHLGRGG